MSMPNKSISLCIVLVISGSCVTNREGGGRFSVKQAEGLAAVILDNTPEHIHYDPSMQFGWVLTAWKPQVNPPEVEAAVLGLLEKKYKVYRTKEEVPEECVERKNGAVRGYKGGFSFSFEVKREGPRAVKVSYFDWEGMLAASWHWERYEWTGWRWKWVKSGPLAIS